MINLTNPIKNTERKFGSSDVYYITAVKTFDGTITHGLFTEKEVLAAVKRADGNTEDILLETSKFAKFMVWVTSFFGGSTRE